MRKKKMISLPDVPIGIAGGFYIEIFSDNEVVLTGDTEIIELLETVLKIKSGEHIVSVVGENLKIINFSSTGIRINGKLKEITFNKKE